MSELIYGRRSVLETLRAGRRQIFRLWLEAEAKPNTITQDIAKAAEASHISINVGSSKLFEKLAADNVNTQGVALEVDAYPYVPYHDALQRAKAAGESPFLLLLDQVQDPQNLGTLLRTAEAMGVHGVLIPDRRAVGVTPAVCNASSGAVEHLLVDQVTNLNRTIEQLKKHNIWVAGLDMAPDATPLHKADLSGALALVVGSEGHGLSRLTREKCDFLVSLPIQGEVASLNAAVAGSIALYAAHQTRL